MPLSLLMFCEMIDLPHVRTPKMGLWPWNSNLANFYTMQLYIKFHHHNRLKVHVDKQTSRFYRKHPSCCAVLRRKNQPQECQHLWILCTMQLSKLESDVCYHMAHLVNAMEVTPGMAESNGSLPPGGWLSHLQADCTPGSAPGPTLGNEYGKTLFFLTECRTVLMISLLVR